MIKRWWQIGQDWLGVCIIVPSTAIAIAALSWTGVLQWVEWSTLDQLIRLRPREAVDERITIITIDEADIRFAQQWPITDQLIAQMIYNLAAHEPRAIGLSLYRDIAVEPGKEALKQALRENLNIIGIEKVADTPITASPTLKELGQVAAGDLILDRDGKVRRAFVKVLEQDTLAAKLASLYLNQYTKKMPPDIFIPQSLGDRLGQAVVSPLNDQDRGYVFPQSNLTGYQNLLNYRGGLDQFNQISFEDVLANRIPKELIRDRLVLVGAIAPSLNEGFLTPYSSQFLQQIQPMPSVVIQANIVSQMISGVLDHRTILQPIKSTGYLTLLIFWSATSAVCIKILYKRLPSLINALTVSGFGTGCILLIGFGSTFVGWVVPVFSPWLAVITATMLTTSYESQKRTRATNQALAIANQKLAEYSSDLETKVSDRTQQLSKTLRDLQTTQSHLVQAEKMAALGQMVAGIAHEVNNPINFISGNVRHARLYVNDLLTVIDLFRCKYQDAELDILLQEIDLEYLKSDFYKLLDSIEKGSIRVKDIVQSLRTFSRLDEAELKQVNLQENIASVLLILNSRIHERQDEFSIKLIQDLQPIPLIQCYAGKINQVLLNIISNAIDAIEEKISVETFTEGEIFLETKQLNDQEILIRIVDNGGGIPENLITKIFDPFFTTKPVGKGTGLGLAIAHTVIVEQHQGTLSCRTTEDGHTEFLITLPISHRFYGVAIKAV